MTRPWCTAGCAAPGLITAVTPQECGVCFRLDLWHQGGWNRTVCQSTIDTNARLAGSTETWGKRESRVLVPAVGYWVFAVFCSACLHGAPTSECCLSLQLLQSWHSSLRHGPHLFSVELFILARIPPWKRGQNKPHVSFNDILKISITGRFLYYIKYACMSKWKVYVKKSVFWSSGILPLP